MGQFERGQRAMRMDAVAHQGQGRDVAVVPQARLDVGGQVAARVDLAFLGRDHGPAALGLDFAHGCVGEWHRMAHAVAVGYLEETVLRRHRPDPHRGEEDVVTGVAHALQVLRGSAILRPRRMTA